LAGRWRLIARAIHVAEQLTIELGQTTSVGGIQNN